MIGTGACQNNNYKIVLINGLTMGTTYSIKIKTADAVVNQEKIRADIEKILLEINQKMSTYIVDSELSVINFSNSLDSNLISDDLFKVISHANTISKTTNGAFDITVGPLVNLWGFGPNKSENKIPSNEEIELIKKNIGYKKIYLNKETTSIKKLHPDLYVDLSGIAKGFAVDKIALYLNSYNLENYLVEIGGELIAKGTNEDNEVWQIGIENPNNKFIFVGSLLYITFSPSTNGLSKRPCVPLPSAAELPSIRALPITPYIGVSGSIASHMLDTDSIIL